MARRRRSLADSNLDPSCNELGCPFSGPSRPGKCTNSAGVMSLTEIKQLIKEKRITPHLNNDSKMKELVWGDQWIGYDDEETHEMKRSFANNLCFGGTMAWSVDFYAGDEMGSSAPISTDGALRYWIQRRLVRRQRLRQMLFRRWLVWESFCSL